MSPAEFVSPLHSQETDVLIVGAGPVGLFATFQLGLLGLKARLIDTLDRPGGQCAELYPDKPIYDIPGWPVISGQDLTDRLMEQIAPFEPEFRFNQRVESLTKRPDGSFQIVTDAGEVHVAPVVFIAAGVGSFTPRRLKTDGIAPYEDKSLFYAVRERAEFEGRDLVILGGGDSALDWTLDLLPSVKSLTLVHRRDKFRATPHAVQAMETAVAKGTDELRQGRAGASRRRQRPADRRDREERDRLDHHRSRPGVGLLRPQHRARPDRRLVAGPRGRQTDPCRYGEIPDLDARNFRHRRHQFLPRQAEADSLRASTRARWRPRKPSASPGPTRS